MASIQGFFSTMLAVIHLALMVAGVAPLGDDPIDYGGKPYPYGEENIRQWLTLAQGGASDYVIVLPAQAKPTEQEAANQLADYIKQISGAALPQVTEAQAAGSKAFHVGSTQAAKAALGSALEALKPEGFIKKVIGETVYLAGKEDENTQNRGTLYAVNSFLEEQLGVRWFQPELTVVPEKDLLRIDAVLDDTQNPYFEYRDPYWSVVFNSAQWKANNKINSDNHAPLGTQYGGGISYADFAHSLQRLVPDELFETQPELFSYREDKEAYTIDQRCLTNPQVLEITLENTRKTLDSNPGAKIMSITQLDNQKYCQCQRCNAQAERLGGQSGLMIWFVNKAARALREEYPDVLFDTFAYQYTRKPPAVKIEGEDGNVTEPNVCVRLCSIECCFCHPLETCGHERGEDIADYVSDIPSTFAEDIKLWQNFCQRLYIWNYSTNFLNSLLPFPNFQVLGPNMQFFAENNVMGVFEQGFYNGITGEFNEMRAYVTAKLLWDPYADTQYHMADFMKAYYGEKSAGYIKEYLDTLTRKTIKTSHLSCFNWHYQNTFLRSWDTIPMDCLWDKAEKAAESDWRLKNIRRSRLALRVYKADMLVGEFFPLNPLRISANKQLFNDVLELGITRWGEHDPIYQPEGLDWLLRPVEWADLETMSWNEGKEYKPLA